MIFAFLIGDRTLDQAREFLEDTTSRMEGKPLFVSDELPHYADSLLEIFPEWIEFESTGKPGRPRKPHKAIQSDVDYATVHKVRENGRIVKVEKRIIFGSIDRIEKKLDNSPSNTINTAYVERTNLDWRLWDAHLARKTLRFAKSMQWLKAKFSIVLAFYNFVRPHGSLSKQGVPITPAMAAGITTCPWSVDDLLRCSNTMSTIW